MFTGPEAPLKAPGRGLGDAVGVGLVVVTLRAGVPVAGREVASGWVPLRCTTKTAPATSASRPAARSRRRVRKVRREVVRGVTGDSLTRPAPTRASRPTARAQKPL